MKKIAIASLLMWLTSVFCHAEPFYFDGIGFEHKKWEINTAKTMDGTVISGTKMYMGFWRSSLNQISITKVRSQGISTENVLTTWVDNIEESFQTGTSKIKVKSRGEVTDRTIGHEITAKSMDLELTRKLHQRFFVFDKKGYTIQIVITYRKGFDSKFDDILNSFVFEPE